MLRRALSGALLALAACRSTAPPEYEERGERAWSAAPELAVPDADAAAWRVGDRVEFALSLKRGANERALGLRITVEDGAAGWEGANWALQADAPAEAPFLPLRLEVLDAEEEFSSTHALAFREEHLAAGSPLALALARSAAPDAVLAPDAELTPDVVARAVEGFLADAALTLTDFEGLADVMKLIAKVVDVPYGRMALKFGAPPDLAFLLRAEHASAVDPTGLPDGVERALSIPVDLTIENVLAARGRVLVRDARPPLALCNGILEAYVEHPGRPERNLTIRLVAASRGNGPVATLVRAPK